jgi:uncharacterized protein (DUF58 family)
MKRIIQLRFSHWLQKRIPANRIQRLSHQKIFILPSRFGLWFLVLCALLFVLGTNYQNNVMKLLCTFLLSLFLLHLFSSYVNFARLKINAVSAPSCFEGAIGNLQIIIGFQHKPAEGIVHLSWWNMPSPKVVSVHINDAESQVLVPFNAMQRGVHTLGRLTLRSDYPLGLFKCWTHLDLDVQVTVFPKPHACALNLVDKNLRSYQETNSPVTRLGNEDLSGFRDFDNSDPLSKVAWKQAAKTQQWMVKLFDDPSTQHGWLTFASTSSNQREQQLSELCYQVLELSKKDLSFGLSLPGIDISPDRGDKHQYRCLQALATYPNVLG